MTVIKRNRESSQQDLAKALEKFITLLDSGGEDQEAVSVLNEAKDELASNLKSSAQRIIEAFEGELELDCYILNKPDPSSWTDADVLSQSASRVLSLAKRLSR